jgi:hypothetical protein
MGGGPSHQMNTSVKWSGRFEQGGNWNEMHFNHMIMNQQGHIEGNGNDAVGGFSLGGHCKGNGHVEINKQYHGAHTVHYRGQMDNRGWIHGKWEIPGNCNGTFELHVDQKSWTGWFRQGGQQHNMDIGLSISGNEVFGNGFDSVGAFTCYGNYSQHNGVMEFTKYYYGAHSVQYKGHHSKHGNQDVVDGDWCIPGNSWDKFHLKMHH